jgi:hypothetical protein
VLRGTVRAQSLRDEAVWYTLDVQGQEFTLPIGTEVGGPNLLDLGDEVELRIAPARQLVCSGGAGA